ncbi:MAG: hypothetical protein KGZ93_02525 [Actinobacteria bacterium]|nr:hypothetical protein [Actinomycetota bacterium]
MVVPFKVIHHIPGRIRVEVPSAKGLTRKDLESLAHIKLPPSIKNMRVNPLNRNLIIEYDPKSIDILAYLRVMASSDEILELFDRDNKRK